MATTPKLANLSGKRPIADNPYTTNPKKKTKTNNIQNASSKIESYSDQKPKITHTLTKNSIHDQKVKGEDSSTMKSIHSEKVKIGNSPTMKSTEGKKARGIIPVTNFNLQSIPDQNAKVSSTQTIQSKAETIYQNKATFNHSPNEKANSEVIPAKETKPYRPSTIRIKFKNYKPARYNPDIQSKPETTEQKKAETNIFSGSKTKIENVHDEKVKIKSNVKGEDEAQQKTDCWSDKSRTESGSGSDNDDNNNNKSSTKPAIKPAVFPAAHTSINSPASCHVQECDGQSSHVNVGFSTTDIATAKGMALTKVPGWFPRKIKEILNEGDSPISPKSLTRLTSYRPWVEQLRQRRWKRYIAAETHKRGLTRYLLSLRARKATVSKAVLQYRLRQLLDWKVEALAAMKNLDKVVKGIKLLDETIGGIYALQRKEYEQHLDRKKRQPTL